MELVSGTDVRWIFPTTLASLQLGELTLFSLLICKMSFSVPRLRTFSNMNFTALFSKVSFLTSVVYIIWFSYSYHPQPCLMSHWPLDFIELALSSSRLSKHWCLTHPPIVLSMILTLYAYLSTNATISYLTFIDTMIKIQFTKCIGIATTCIKQNASLI